MSTASRLASLAEFLSLSQLGSFLGSIGIAGSLLLVAYELKQSRDIAVVQLASQRLDLQTRMIGRVNVDAQIAHEGMVKFGAGKEVSEEQWNHAANYSANLWHGLSLTHLTYEKDLLDEKAWTGQLRDVQIEICDTDTGEFFEMIGAAHAILFTPSFAEVVSDLINLTDCQALADLSAADHHEQWTNKTRDTEKYTADRVETPDQSLTPEPTEITRP
jgi:hypothetical protein